MKKVSLNKDGTPRKRRNSKSAATPTVSLSIEEIAGLAANQVAKIPVSEDWVKSRLYANYLVNKNVSHDFSDHQSVEDKIEYALTDFDNE
jgi:hypothetical protein